MTIEITWKNTSDISIFNIVDLSHFILWLLTTISKTPELQKDNGINGYVLLNDEKSNCGALLFVNKKYQKKILDILQQPPGEFKDKYIACVPYEEPQSVKEISEEKNIINKDDDDDDDSLKT